MTAPQNPIEVIEMLAFVVIPLAVATGLLIRFLLNRPKNNVYRPKENSRKRQLISKRNQRKQSSARHWEDPKSWDLYHPKDNGNE